MCFTLDAQEILVDPEYPLPPDPGVQQEQVLDPCQELLLSANESHPDVFILLDTCFGPQRSVFRYFIRN